MKIVIIFLILLFWPLNLFLANTLTDWLHYILPAILLIISFLLFSKNSKSYIFPVLLVPFIEPKLTLLPILISLFVLITDKNKKIALITFFLSLIAFCIVWKPFWGQTVFKTDYEAQQSVIRKSQLYPNVFMARSFQNKARIPLDKITYNFFALIDPNNYFFGFQPRQIIVNNQNIDKFPFVSLIFFIFGLYTINKNQNKKFVLITLFASLISLIVLNSFDRNDFILWLPLSLVILHGVNKLQNKYLYLIFLIFTVPQLIRILVLR